MSKLTFHAAAPERWSMVGHCQRGHVVEVSYGALHVAGPDAVHYCPECVREGMERVREAINPAVTQLGDLMKKCAQAAEDLSEALAQGEGRQRKWDARYLSVAKLVSSWSKDISTKVGAVIVGEDNSIVSLGYNGFAKGVDDSPARYEDRDVKYKLVVHAERNAIVFADRCRLRGATLYTWPFMPCSPCAATIIQAGIKRCVAPLATPELERRWGDDLKLAKQQFEEAGVELVLY